MFWSKNKKNRHTPAYPSFAVSKWGIRGYTIHGHVFLMKKVYITDPSKEVLLLWAYLMFLVSIFVLLALSMY